MPLQPAGEVVGVDRQAVIVVETVCVKALRADSRIQMQLAASKPSTLLDQPLQQQASETPTPCLGRSREIIDVQVMTPSEIVVNAESSDRTGRFAIWREGAEEPIAGGSQHTVHMLDELPLAFVGRPQCAHRLVGEMGLAGKNLPGLCRVGLHSVETLSGGCSARGPPRRSTLRSSTRSLHPTPPCSTWSKLCGYCPMAVRVTAAWRGCCASVAAPAPPSTCFLPGYWRSASPRPNR